MARTGKSTYRVLGIDPGLNITGYAVLDFGNGEPKILEAGALKTNPKAPMAERIALLYKDLCETIEELKPQAAAVEQLYAHYKHPRTAILIGHARGIILLACQNAGLELHDLPATKVKKSLTGNGHASKRQMQLAVQSVCKLTEPPEPADVADAIAIALCAGNRILSV